MSPRGIVAKNMKDPPLFLVPPPGVYIQKTKVFSSGVKSETITAFHSVHDDHMHGALYFL